MRLLSHQAQEPPMLSLFDDSREKRGCGVTRRDFLRIGTLGLGGISLPQLFRAEASAGIRSSQKSVILIYLVGGPPHQDMFDLKPDAPKEIAGPWRPIATNVTGIQICEAFPRLARIMDKLVVVRSLVGNQADHDAIQVFNGHHPSKPTPPAAGRSSARPSPSCKEPVDRATPPFISLCYTCTHGPYNEPGPGFLGHLVRSVPPDGPGARRHGAARRLVDAARRPQGLAARASTTLRRDVDASGTIQGMDAFTEQAFGLLTSSRLAEALDLSQGRPAASSRATAPATRRSSWTATARPACRKACSWPGG